MWKHEFNHRILHAGCVVDGVALGQVFSEYFSFPLPVITPPIPHTDTSSRAGKIGPFEATVSRYLVSLYSYKS
jgi:hypothetical protein